MKNRTRGAAKLLVFSLLGLLASPLDAAWQPSPHTSWQWQLTGTIDTSYDVEMYDIDLFDASQSVIDQLHGDGRTVICYFSAGSWEDWRSDAGDFPESVKGKDLDGWADEKWLDISQLDDLGPIMEERLDLAVSKGCDGVEPDNVDGYANDTGFPLTYQDQLDYNLWLSTAAHARDLSVGLKNDLDQIPDLVAAFDWALNEQCFQYDECASLRPFITAGKAVFGVEYYGLTGSFCPDANDMDFDWLKKNLDLDAWRYSCREDSGGGGNGGGGNGGGGDDGFSCPAVLALGRSAQREANVLRRVRDEVLMPTPMGRRYVELYYEHAPEVVRLLEENPRLLVHASALLVVTLPDLERLLAGETTLERVRTRATRLGMGVFLRGLAREASPSLKQTLYQMWRQ